jgi:hypothetical protein
LGEANTADQKYGPPLIGMAETISAILKATQKLKTDTMIQLTTITDGPPVAKEYPNNDMILAGAVCSNIGISPEN